MNQDQAKILRGVAGVYLLHRYGGEAPAFSGLAVPRGIFRKRGHRPLPGDDVVFESSGDPDIPWVICSIAKRRNELVRPPMANLDQILITVSAALPAIDYYLVDRLTAYAVFHKIEPLILINKCDQNQDPGVIETCLANYRPAGFPCFQLGLNYPDDLELLREAIKGHTVAFAGQSGVGKSTIINRLFGKDKMDTGDLSQKGKRGRQTTRHIELFPKAGGYVADTPGFQTIELMDLAMTPVEFSQAYPEIAKAQSACRFNDCRHFNEPGCGVPGIIYPDRLSRYRELRQDLERDLANRY